MSWPVKKLTQLMYGTRKLLSKSLHHKFVTKGTPCRCMSSTDKPCFNINFEKHDGRDIAILRMESGENRMTPEFMTEFFRILSEIESNKSCKALITTGAGKFYSNGLDQLYIPTLDKQGFKEYLDEFARLSVRFLVYPMVTVAALNGHAFAGGAVLAMAHDSRLMRRDRGWICWSEIYAGVRFPTVLIELLKQKIAPKHHVPAIVYGKRYTAVESLDAGLVDHITEEVRLLDDAKLIVTQILGSQNIDREAIQLFKRDLYSNLLEIFPESK